MNDENKTENVPEEENEDVSEGVSPDDVGGSDVPKSDASEEVAKEKV